MSKLTLEQILKYKPAEKAFEELVKAKVVKGRLDAKMLEYWLLEIAAASRYPRSQGSLQAEKRKTEALAKKSEKLAKQIEQALLAPSSAPIMWPGEDLQLSNNMPRMLREFAAAWRFAHQLLWMSAGRTSPENENIAGLISGIEYATGRPHYRQIADLLNGIHAAKYSERRYPRFDKEQLRYLSLREKKRMAKLLELPLQSR